MATAASGTWDQQPSRIAEAIFEVDLDPLAERGMSARPKVSGYDMHPRRLGKTSQAFRHAWRLPTVTSKVAADARPS